MRAIIPLYLMTLLGAVFLSHLPARGATMREATIPFLDETVLLDGLLDEPVWQQAATLDSFTQAGMGRNQPAPLPVTRSTTVRVFYSARCLYLGIVAEEPAMDGLNRGVPDEGYPDAPLEWTGDVLELFLQTAEDQPQFFHLAFNPNGARWDASKLQGTGWNGQWRAVTSFHHDRYLAEIEIPFTTLAGPGEIAATPPAGAVWRANVCRVAKPTGEFGTWSHTPTNFPNTAAFGRWTFASAGRPALSVSQLDFGDLPGGRGTVRFTLANGSPGPLALQAVLAAAPADFGPARPAVELTRQAVTIAPGQTAAVALPYALETQGDQRLVVSLRQDRQPLYEAGISFSLYPLQAELAKAAAFLDTARGEIAAIAALPVPRLAPEAAALANAASRLAELQARLARDGTSLELVNEGKSFLAESILPRRLVHASLVRPIAWLTARQLPIGHLVFGVDVAGAKHFADEPYDGPLADAVELGLAGNELESRQLALLPLTGAIGTVRLSTAGLQGPQGAALPSSSVTFHRVGTVHLKPAPVGSRGGLWPDPLYPTDTVELGDSPVHIVVTVAAPAGQAPGLYEGVIRVTRSDGSVVGELPLRATVYPFSLPKQLHFMMDFWLSEHHVRAYFGELTLDRFAKLMEVMGLYHFATLPGLDTMLRQLTTYLEPDGDLTFDFGGCDPWFETAARHGLAGINLSFTNNYAALRNAFTVVKATRRANGASVSILVDDPDKLTGHYLAQLYAHLIAKGWFPGDRIYCDIADEPWTPQARELVRDYAAKVRAAVPGARCYAAGTRKGEGLDDSLGAWVPQIRQFDAADYGPDDQVWWYQCLYKAPLATFSINRPATELRTLFWLCWKYRVSGFLYWSSIYWGTSADYSKFAQRPDADKRVHDRFPVPFDGTDFPGDALFFYPSGDGVVPNLRSLDIREGIDDWEYLYRLDWLARQARDRRLAVPDGVDALLAVPGEIGSSPRVYTHDANLLNAARQQVAEAIGRLQEAMPDLGDPP